MAESLTQREESADRDLDNEWFEIPDAAPVKFNSMEHADIPSQCLLKMTADPKDPGVSGRSSKSVLFHHERENFDITFAFTIACAGDFYSTKDPARTIGFAQNFDEGEKGDGCVQRFDEAVQAMRRDDGDLINGQYIGPLKRTYGLKEYLSEEVSGLESLLTDQPVDADKSVQWKDESGVTDQRTLAQNKGAHNVTQAYVNKTDGVITDVRTVGRIGLRYGDIVLNNMDHFGEDAWRTYKAGHTIALRKAKAGTRNPEKLKEAYMYDAFALHYLTDQFASGHVRSPREALNQPSTLGKTLTAFNKVFSFLGLTWFAPDAGVWDAMSGITHDTDGAIGLRVRNKRGDEWITFGDKLYFAEHNRANRLKSIECAQASIDEVYKAWLDGKYEDYYMNPAKNDVKPMCDEFRALQIAPIWFGHTIKDTSDSTGNPSPLWVVERDASQAKQRELVVHGGTRDTTAVDAENMKAVEEAIKKNQKEIDKIKDSAKKTEALAALAAQIQKTKPTGDARITGTPQVSENGFWWARRTDVENCSVNTYQWGFPGTGWFGASSDVKWIEESYFNQTRWPAEARACEALSGGFIQVQEYAVDLDKVNYAVNVWGPVQVPTKFVSQKTQKALEAAGKPWQNNDRQMTFTFRGRKDSLTDDMETTTDNKTLRWHSWYNGKGKTSLIKFSFNTKDPQNPAIYLESWKIQDPDPNVKQQWIQYESLNGKPENMLKFGGPDKKDPKASGPNSQNETARTKILGVSKRENDDFGHLTRFFIFPFLKDSTRSNPDILVFSFKGTTSTSGKPSVSVVSTETGLLKPTYMLSSEPPDIYLPEVTSSLFIGLAKRFEDVNNKGILLHARARRQDQKVGKGVTIVPRIFWHDADNNKISFKEDRLSMKIAEADLPTTDDFYQVLVGDTRRSGHREMVAVVGTFPKFYIQAWELDADRTWKLSSGTPTGMPIPQILNADYQDKNSPAIVGYANRMVNQFCALIPNEWSKKPADDSSNGQNILLVTTFYSMSPKGYYYWINFRTYIKDGTKVAPLKEPVEVEPTVPTGQQSAQPAQNSQQPQKATQQPQKPAWQPQPGRTYYKNWVVVNWDSTGTIQSLVPGWQFWPDGATQLADLPSQYQPPDDSTITFWGTYDRFGSVFDLNSRNNDPLVGPTQAQAPTPETKEPNMAIVWCPGVEPGRLVRNPAPKFADAMKTKPVFKLPAYRPDVPVSYAAVGVDVSQISPTCVVKPTDEGKGDVRGSKWTLYTPDGSGRVQGATADIKDGYGVSGNWFDDVETEYVFDLSTKRPMAIMYKVVSGSKRYRILNPDAFFRVSANPAPTPQPAKGSFPVETPINTINTAKPAIVKQDREYKGWSSYIDSTLEDTFVNTVGVTKGSPYVTKKHYKSMGWRLCKVGATITGEPMYGVMQVLSLHGVLGCRVYAPREPGEYHRWVCRGFQPYMGQTALGTGYDAYGNWNDNASQLSWGATEDFADINIWNEKTRSWTEPAKWPYKRGFEAKTPEDPEKVPEKKGP